MERTVILLCMEMGLLVVIRTLVHLRIRILSMVLRFKCMWWKSRERESPMVSMKKWGFWQYIRMILYIRPMFHDLLYPCRNHPNNRSGVEWMNQSESRDCLVLPKALSFGYFLLTRFICISFSSSSSSMFQYWLTADQPMLIWVGYFYRCFGCAFQYALVLELTWSTLFDFDPVFESIRIRFQSTNFAKRKREVDG